LSVCPARLATPIRPQQRQQEREQLCGKACGVLDAPTEHPGEQGLRLVLIRTFSA
jgi:hypothetical protein